MADYQKVKYIRELTEYWIEYVSSVIDEIYVGVGMSLGLSENEAYQQIKTNPETLKKAGIFKKLLDRFKRFLPDKIPKFRPKKINIKEMTPKHWENFNNALDKYWKNVADSITGDVTTKGFLFGRQTAEFEKRDKPYQNKSLAQIIQDQFKGNMPSSIAQAYRKYDFSNAEKNAYNRQLSNTAMYVTEVNNDIKESIRQVVNQGISEGKSNIEIASDLYWNVEKDETLRNKHTAETMRRNWSRVANTESATIYEAGKLSKYEADAMKSLKDPEKAQYFVRTGGNCHWCQSMRGTISRLVPTSVVVNQKNNSLKDMGIKDPVTDSGIWIGQSNAGIKNQSDWMPCCPGHPNNVATNEPIDIDKEFYNSKTDDVEKRQVKQKFVPQLKDYSYQSPEEKEFRKPTFIGDNLVRMNNNVYEAVEDRDFAKKQEEQLRNPMLPIPVNKKSPDYIYIFKEAEKNK